GNSRGQCINLTTQLLDLFGQPVPLRGHGGHSGAVGISPHRRQPRGHILGHLRHLHLGTVSRGLTPCLGCRRRDSHTHPSSLTHRTGSHRLASVGEVTGRRLGTGLRGLGIELVTHGVSFHRQLQGNYCFLF